MADGVRALASLITAGQPPRSYWPAALLFAHSPAFAGPTGVTPVRFGKPTTEDAACNTHSRPASQLHSTRVQLSNNAEPLS